MTKTLIKIIINKHSKYFACLAQSVEHSAVNRSVGGPSPSTGAKKNVKTFFFLCLFGDLYPCRTVVRKHFVPRHFFRIGRVVCRKQVYTQRYFTGSVLSLQKPNGCKHVLFFVPVWRLVPLPHICAAALCATTLLPNWTRCVVVNKFTHNATSRGSVLPLQELKRM